MVVQVAPLRDRARAGTVAETRASSRVGLKSERSSHACAYAPPSSSGARDSTRAAHNGHAHSSATLPSARDRARGACRKPRVDVNRAAYEWEAEVARLDHAQRGRPDRDLVGRRRAWTVQAKVAGRALERRSGSCVEAQPVRSADPRAPSRARLREVDDLGNAFRPALRPTRAAARRSGARSTTSTTVAPVEYSGEQRAQS